jgi:hypothetical protein
LPWRTPLARGWEGQEFPFEVLLDEYDGVSFSDRYSFPIHPSEKGDTVPTPLKILLRLLLGRIGDCVEEPLIEGSKSVGNLGVLGVESGSDDGSPYSVRFPVRITRASSFFRKRGGSLGGFS